MTEASDRFVIVGANLTGGAAATTLRSEGFEGAIFLIGEEPHLPYERPPLSKEYLRGEAGADRLPMHSPSWYEENEVELILGAHADRVAPREKVVRLADGREIGFDKVLVATGGRNRRLGIPGGDLDGVLELRTIEDADRIRAEAQPGRRALVVGAGFIGCEVAACLRHLDVDVQVVEIFGTPLQRHLGPDVGAVIERIHRDRGVVFHLGQSVVRFDGGDRVEEAVTNTGLGISCDFVVVGVGIEPNVDVVSGTDVAVEDGILVDELCRTSVHGIYAAGDVASHDHPIFGRRLRVEHWDNALKQGAAAARSMLGTGEPYDDPHWFWSDQYEHNLQSIGLLSDWDEQVIRGSLEGRSFVAFYLREGVLVGAVGLNRGKDVRRCAALIHARRVLDPASLKDEDVDLRKLSAADR